MNNIQLNFEKSIQSSNLDLEPILPKHALLLFPHLQSVESYTYIPFNAPKSLESLEERYRRWSARKSEDGSEIWLNYAIYSRQTNEYVGTLQATIEAEGRTYIAYNVFPTHWRRGIAYEAVHALISYLFKECGVEVVSAHVDRRNIASFKLLESLNFCRTKMLKDADHFKGSSSDEYVYELKKSEGWCKSG